jgi:hypothetical protein
MQNNHSDQNYLTENQKNIRYCKFLQKYHYAKCEKLELEALLSQLDGQFSMNIKIAKSFNGLATLIISKITLLTMIQYPKSFVFHCYLTQIGH